jgi:hypothetical protein
MNKIYVNPHWYDGICGWCNTLTSGCRAFQLTGDLKWCIACQKCFDLACDELLNSDA